MSQEILKLFDRQEYEKVIEITNPYNKNNIGDFELLYYLKSILATNDFKIQNKKEIKKLFFYYFYLLGEVQFENGYTFLFKKEMCDISFLNFYEDIGKIKSLKNYFNFGKNEVFLNKIIDVSNGEKILQREDGAVEVDNVVDFFLYFVHECSELYAFKGDHFPLFKWLINELT